MASCGPWLLEGLVRVHVLPSWPGVYEAGVFIASSLLVSHGVRRDSAALVARGDYWLVARGDRVRHLRPDADSLEGWVRAVLRGRPLGASVCPRGSLAPRITLRVCTSGGDVLGIGEALARAKPPYVLEYREVGGCDASLGASWMPLHLAPAVVNVVIDRVLGGLPPL